MSYPPPPPPPGSGSFSPRPGQFPPPPQPPPGQYPQPGQYAQPGQYPQPGQYAQPGQQGAPGAPGPYPPQQAVVQSLPRLRGRTLLRLSVIFLVVGLAAMITGGALLEGKALSKVKGFQRVSIAAGSGTVHLSAGNYLAYYEAHGADSLDKNIPLPAVALRSPSGKVMVLDTLYGGASRDSLKLKSHLTYSTDGHDGVAIYQFKAPETGDYQVQVQSTIAASGSDIAFGPSIAKSTAISVIIAVLGGLLFVAGVVLLIIGLVKRRNHKKEIRQHGYVVSLQQPGPPAQYPAPGQNPNPNPGSMYDEQFRPPQ